MRTIVNKIVTKIKGSSYQIDPSIPTTYLLQLIITRIIMAIRGSLLRLNKDGIIFIAGHTTIKCKSKIRIGKGSSIDKNCYIDALSHEGITLGNNVSIGKHTNIECSGTITNIGKGLKVGNNVGMGTHGFWGCAGGIEIGDDTIISNYVSFHSENHNFQVHDIPIRLQGVNRKGIKIGQNCWIGAKATILDGTQIGNGCVIAAGAVVSGIFPDNVVIGGVPARIIKNR